MAVTALSPLRDFKSLRATMDRPFDEALIGPGRWLTLAGAATPYLPLDVYETPDAFVVRALVPGDACEPGVESMDCGFFSRRDCPWSQVAYPQVNDSIRQAYDDLDSGRFDVWQAEMTDTRYELRPVLDR